VLQRSVARVKGIALVDLARHANQAPRGWTEDSLSLVHVPAPNGGTAGPLAGLKLLYFCRDYFIAFQLGDGSETGAQVWGALGTGGSIQLSLSAKPDNRLYLSVDAANNLNVTTVTWGMTVPTTVTMANGSASITTSGHSDVSVPNNFTPQLPGLFSGTITGTTPANSGQCLYVTNGWYGNTDWRTWLMHSPQAPTLTMVSDNCRLIAEPDASYNGGQMFIATDASAEIDCVLRGAGTATHPLGFGSDCLATTVSGYTSRTQATLGAVNAQPSLSGVSRAMFLGSISNKPQYHCAVAAGSDTGAGPVITVKLSGTHLRVGYVRGGMTLANIRLAIQNHEVAIWEGEVERFGGPFNPTFTASAPLTITPLYM
jgi:hypothetical protein